MKTIFFILSLVISVGLSAQSKPATPKKETPASQPNPKESLVTKSWKVAFIEEFKVKTAPRGTSKNDAVNLKDDKTFIVVLDGLTRTGTWSMNKGGTQITLIPDASNEEKGTFYFKIKRLDETGFEFTYQDPSLITKTYFLEPK